MRNDPAHLPLPPDGGAARLARNKDRVITLWVERVRHEIPAAHDEPHPIIVDTLPLLIDQLVETLADPVRRPIASDGSTACQEHGGERARVTRYGIESVVHEYQILREVILEVLGEEGPLPVRDQDLVRRSLDDQLRQAAIAFGLVQNTIREQFVATLTHDLRGPLSAALSAAELILKYSDRPEQHPRLAAKIVRNLATVDQMISNLLDANRVRAGERLSLEITECDAAHIAREVIEEIAIVHNLSIELEAADAPVHADRSALRRVFENLCTNAIKYGDVTRPITIKIEQAHGRTIVRVHNEGNPIPLEEQETLFAAYRRTLSAERGTAKGWGLGLALVRGVAESHGGSVMVDSGPERGTTFTVDIPSDARPFQKSARQPFVS